MKKKIVLLSYLLIISLLAFSQEDIKITHGPYLQAMTDNSVTIVWTTNKPSIAWVELAPDDTTHFYQKVRDRYFNSSNGLKNISKVHQVKLDNLRPNTKYRYRIYSTEVLQHEWVNVTYGKTAASVVYKKQPLTFSTNGKVGDFEFAVINDIHERNDVMKQLLSQVDMPNTGFIVFNGDMVNNSSSEEQIFSGFMDTAIQLFASEKPFYYARGNHETRAPFASQFPNYFPSNNGHLYYMFIWGNTCFIVLDGGEDKPDSDIEYSGITDMDFYRSQQAEWLKKAIKSETFTKAKFKVVINHIPAVNGWHGNQEILEKWVPILNQANIDLMISAHEHRHRIIPKNTQVNFPVIVNSNNNLVKAKVTDTHATFTIFDTSGKKVEGFSVIK